MELSRRNLLKLGATAGLGGLLLPAFDMQANISDQMILRAVPSTGEQIPVIGMGTWQTFDVGKSEEDRAPLREVLKVFVEKGGKLIDSSPMYGNSEGVVGDLAQSMGLEKSLFVATKVWTTGEAAGKQQMAESARLLKAPIDLMQVHNLLDYATHIKTLRGMKEKGLIRYIGITHYTTDSYGSLARIIKNDSIDFVQFNYSIETREAEKELLPLCDDKKVAVIINRPFEGGNMFAKVKGMEIPSWASDFNIKSWGQFFLKYIVSHPAVTCVIPATSKARHMEDNMQAGFGRLPDENQRRKMVEFIR